MQKICTLGKVRVAHKGAISGTCLVQSTSPPLAQMQGLFQQWQMVTISLLPLTCKLAGNQDTSQGVSMELE